MLNKNEKDKVFDAIEKLFNLKGIYNTIEQIKILTEYFANTKYYLTSILNGIKRLESEPLDAITNDRLEESIKATLKHNPNNMYPNCIYCEDMGIVSMVDEKGYGTSLACKCERGRNRHDLVFWTGKEEQFSNGRLLKMANPHKLKPIIYDVESKEKFFKEMQLKGVGI
jgi:hypothetical protein